MATPDKSAQPPAEIAQEFYPNGLGHIERLRGGSVNTTYRVADTAGRLTILQQLGASSFADKALDYQVVSEHLRHHGLNVPAPLTTSEGKLTVADKLGNLWRGYDYLTCDNGSPNPDMSTLVAFSGLVGRTSSILAELDYTPRCSIPNFHDAEHIRSRLVSNWGELSDRGKTLANCLCNSLGHEIIFDGQKQLIHGDPKLANALFKDKLPFTLIDWDTLMLGDPLIDLADMLRSVTGRLRERSRHFTSSDLVPLIMKYYKEFAHITADNALVERSVSATRAMCVLLAMRYLTDSVEGIYFQWDPTTAPSHAQQCYNNAERQWLNYRALL